MMTTDAGDEVSGEPRSEAVEDASSEASAGGTDIALLRQRGGLSARVADAVLKIVGVVPASRQVASHRPAHEAALLGKAAARKAAGISGGAALVPGPLGMLSLLPDLIGVWKVQSQMVADIAAAYGRTATLTREQMLYCLFKHLFSHGLRDVVVRSGERFLVRRASLQLLQTLAGRIGVKMSQRTVGSAIARYAPVVGALGVGTYAYLDTRQVARTAIELFEGELVFDGQA